MKSSEVKAVFTSVIKKNIFLLLFTNVASHIDQLQKDSFDKTISRILVSEFAILTQKWLTSADIFVSF